MAIVEVIPDPRNHLALTRDPTCEVRLTPAQLAVAMATAPTPAAPAPTGRRPTCRRPSFRTLTAGGSGWLGRRPLTRQQARRADVRWSIDTAEVRLPASPAPTTPTATPPCTPSTRRRG